LAEVNKFLTNLICLDEHFQRTAGGVLIDGKQTFEDGMFLNEIFTWAGALIFL
jgi:hypothetical protein